MCSEVWAPVAGYEGLYEVSTQGRVRSLEREETSSNRWGPFVRKRNAKVLRERVTPTGYIQVQLYTGGKGKFLLVHRIVATTFLPLDQERPHVNHKDGVKANNAVDNLEWATQSENMKHARASGLYKGDKCDIC